MDIVAFLTVLALDTQHRLARHVIELQAGVFKVLLYPIDPSKAPVIVKRFTTEEQAEAFLLSLLPKPAPTMVDA